jgi:hypothetical protein
MEIEESDRGRWRSSRLLTGSVASLISLLNSEDCAASHIKFFCVLSELKTNGYSGR